MIRILWWFFFIEWNKTQAFKGLCVFLMVKHFFFFVDALSLKLGYQYRLIGTYLFPCFNRNYCFNWGVTWAFHCDIMSTLHNYVNVRCCLINHHEHPLWTQQWCMFWSPGNLYKAEMQDCWRCGGLFCQIRHKYYK